MPDNMFYAITMMPISKVQEDKNATACQKRYAASFDVNKNGIFDEEEADLFNATTFKRQNNNTVVFSTQVKNKKIFGSSNENISQTFKDNPNDIEYGVKNLNGREIAPHKDFHYDVVSNGFSGEAKVKGVLFENNSAKKYTEVYYNNQRMNAVLLKDGTTVIYPDEQNGSVKMVDEGDLHFGYSWGWGWDINKNNVSPAGNGGWKITEGAAGKFFAYFNKLKNAVIIGTGKGDKYQLNKCTDCTVDVSHQDEQKDKVYIDNGNNKHANNIIKQNAEDATRMRITNDNCTFEIVSDGKDEIKTDKLYDDCTNVSYKRKLFRSTEWSGIKNNQFKYDEKGISDKDIRYWE